MMAMEAQVRYGWISLICPKCRDSYVVGRGSFKKFFLQDHFWRRAANWLDDCEEADMLYRVWKSSPKTAESLVKGEPVVLPEEFDPEFAICVLKLAGRKGVQLTPEQRALLTSTALEIKGQLDIRSCRGRRR
jgi:hypothetical protein